MRILWAIFGTKMYIWYTAPLAKINYLDFNMLGLSHIFHILNSAWLESGLSKRRLGFLLFSLIKTYYTRI